MSRTSHIQRVLEQPTFNKVTQCRVLLVGAGGIGCELLKNLVLSGFRSIELIARDSALKFNPDVEIIAHHANIKDSQFNVEWFQRFDIVMNALDNLEARRHVNFMCLAANVPLIESGTEGYLGQVTVIKKDLTECYDCQPKPTRKTYAVCTIRSTPSSPIHCIVWAKSYLFSQLFGEPEDEPLDNEMNNDNAEEIQILKKETELLKEIKLTMGSQEYAEKVFKKVFTDDIERLLTMEDMWKERRPPVPLAYNDMNRVSSNGENGLDHNDDMNTLKDQRMWTFEENFNVFVDRSDLNISKSLWRTKHRDYSINRISRRLLEEQEINPVAVLTFDKDDDDALDFVTATANLRAKVFGIEQKSRFQVKAMAGNIIPAIATTNATIAGIIVVQAFNILKNRLEDCKTTYLDGFRRPCLLINESLNGPNPSCSQCRVNYYILRINTKKATLKDFLEKILNSSHEQGLIYGDEITVERGASIIYDIEFDEKLDSTFEQLEITDGVFIKVTPDDANQLPAVFSIFHRETFDTQDTWYEIEGGISEARVSHIVASNQNTETESGTTLKRKLESTDMDLDEQPSTSCKKMELDPEYIITVEDSIIMTEDGPKSVITLD
ncbi:9152_t:CDS:10 [Ambispora gerdemannii]|uniref:Ubiquitin-activating enzyme E1-like n=1 Tax=Ambispora gerdemannii TaxID=144530 RepID=A0A9N9C4K9_9GLOM|nr:9152_t:CDS:10 [Ambispora gerdemannii]